jgi:hypothetical protein
MDALENPTIDGLSTGISFWLFQVVELPAKVLMRFQLDKAAWDPGE